MYYRQKTKSENIFEFNFSNLCSRIDAIRCHVTRTQKLTRCGHADLTYGEIWSSTAETMAITSEDCRRAYEQQELHMDGKVFSIHIDRPHHINYLSRGGPVSSDGSCPSPIYDPKTSWGEQLWGGWYERTYVDLIVEKVTGDYDPTQNAIYFKMAFNDPALAAGMDDEEVFDERHGLFLWDKPKDVCDYGLSQVYSGNVSYYTDLKSLDNGRLGDLVVVHPEDALLGGGQGGFKITGVTSICDTLCYRTHVSGLSICFLNPVNPVPISLPTSMTLAQSHQLALQSANGYRYLDTRMLYAQRHTDIERAICEQNREIKRNRLALILQGSEFALREEFGVGHDIVAKGGVVYVRECKRYNCTLLEPKDGRCYAEIGVTKLPPHGEVFNSSKLEFVNTFTHVISPLPNNVTCHEKFPVRHNIGQGWFSQGPDSITHDNKTPSQLKPQTFLANTTWMDNFALGLSENGIFTVEMLQNIRDEWVATRIRQPVVTDLVHRMAAWDESNNVVNIGSPLTDDDKFGFLGDMGHLFLGPLEFIFTEFTTVVAFMTAWSILWAILDFFYKVRVGYRENQGKAGWWILTIPLQALWADKRNYKLTDRQVAEVESIVQRETAEKMREDIRREMESVLKEEIKTMRETLRETMREELRKTMREEIRKEILRELQAEKC